MTNPEPANSTGANVSDFRALTSAYLNIVASIRSGENPRENFAAATNLATLLRNYAEIAANLRALMALKILESEEINTRQLAEILNVSKQRASQLTLTGRIVKRMESEI